MIKFISALKGFLNGSRQCDGPASESSKNSKVGGVLPESVFPPEVTDFESSFFSDEEEEPLPSSEEDESDCESEVSLFPKPMFIDNTLSVNSTAIPCSYNDNMHQPGVISPSYSSSLNGVHGALMHAGFSPSHTKLSTGNQGFAMPFSFNQHNGGVARQNNGLAAYSVSDHSVTNPASAMGTPAMVPPQQNTSPSALMHHNTHLTNNSNMNSPIPTANLQNNSQLSGVSPAVSSGTEELPSDFNLPPDVNYVCHYCDATFQVRGYLSRHIKKHAIVKEYTCPYYRYSEHVKEYVDHELQNRAYSSEEERVDAMNKAQSIKHVCHNNKGEFWRKDTLLVHLKKKHFKIDKDAAQAAIEHGGKKIDSNKLPGYCISCNKECNNADDFYQRHVLKDGCSALPHGYTIKTDLEDDKNRNSKCVLKLIKFSNKDARFIFTKSAVVDPGVFSNREVIDLIVDMAEKNANNNTQPDVSPDNNKITPVSSGGNSTPIVEKLEDNRIVIHPDAVVPIDINKKRKKRRSKKEMMLFRGEVADDQAKHASNDPLTSPGLQPFVSASSLSSTESNSYNINTHSSGNLYNHLVQPQNTINNVLQSPENQFPVLDAEQRAQQQQLIYQLYHQQHQKLLQQQVLQQQQDLQYQFELQQLNQHNAINTNTYNQSFTVNSQTLPVNNSVTANDEDDDFRALDDECEHNKTESNTNFSGRSSPGSSTTYNVNNINTVNSEKAVLEDAGSYGHPYGQQGNSYFKQHVAVEEEELAMDDGF